MGKIRIKTLGDESAEKKQKQDAKKRAETKLAEEKQSQAAKDTSTDEAPKQAAPADKAVEAEKKETKKKKTQGKQKIRSPKYVTVAALIDKKKVYTLSEALEILPKLKLASFDETVELHINTSEAGVTGSVTLPHGTGKKMRVVIADQTNDPKAVDDLVKKVESGSIDFDILIATPDSMPKLARVAKFLGPRGLMPNPKNGTVTPKPESVAKIYAGGQINFKTEAKFPLLHLTVGKLSFGDKKLEENIRTFIGVLPEGKVKSITLKSTMSPGIKLTLPSV